MPETVVYAEREWASTGNSSLFEACFKFVTGSRDRCTLGIYVPAMPEAEDQNYQTPIFDLADEPVVADAILPEFSEARTAQRLADASRIAEFGDPIVKELQDTAGLLRVEFAEFTVRAGGQLNAVGHGVS
jgi:hypothetical protein